MAHGWWPEAGGAGHKRALCLVAAGAGLVTGGVFLLCTPGLSPEHHEWYHGNDLHNHYVPKKPRTPGNAQKLLEPKLELEPEPEPEPQSQPQPEPQPQLRLDADFKSEPVSPPTVHVKPPHIALRSPAIAPKSPHISPRLSSLSAEVTIAPLSRDVSWGSAAFDRARQTTPSELRKAFNRMSQSHSKDLWKLGEVGTNSTKVLSKDDFLHVCTAELDLDLSASEIERLFDQLDETKAGTLNFAQFRRAVDRSSFFKTIASNYNSPV